jgi:hypothetical protein
MTIEEGHIVTNPTEIENKEKDDVLGILENEGYITQPFVNGTTTGIRFQGIPNTKGVHVDIVHILDLRKVRFSRAILGMKAAVLEKTHRSLESILSKFELEDRYEEKKLRTLNGRIILPMLKSKNLRQFSLVHDTRNVFVVTEDLGTSIDFSWLTKRDHIVSVSQLSMALKGNVASIKEVGKFVEKEK